LTFIKKTGNFTCNFSNGLAEVNLAKRKRGPIVLTLHIIPEGTTDQRVVFDVNPTMFCIFNGEYQRAMIILSRRRR